VQTRTLTSTTVITYAYGAANQLVNVDGVDYTRDANPLRYAARTSPPRFTSGTSPPCFTLGTSRESAERRCAHLHL
jgi:hypothetical protein